MQKLKKNMMGYNKVALVTGVTGQTASYLVELLLEKGYTVHGIVRRASTINTERIDHIYKDPHEETKFFLHYADLADSSSIEKVIRETNPDEIYNLAAQSHVRVSFDIPEYTANITGLGALRILEAIRNINPKIKYYQASSSEMFGASPPPQNEKTPFHPRSPYGCAKVFAYNTTVNYRESYGLFACNGILFNHESERRGETFVTRKITKGLANILADRQSKLYSGNLDAKRDWGHAKDYCEAIYLMMQQAEADDYVIGTGETHSVKEFVQKAFAYRGLDWRKYVVIDPKYYRPAEVDVLLSDPSKAMQKLNWKPKITFEQLVERMVDYDTSGINQ